MLCSLGAHTLLAYSMLTPYVAMVILGLGYSLLASALWPMVALLIPESRLGTAYGFMQAVQNLGLAVVSIVAGSIVDNKVLWRAERLYATICCHIVFAFIRFCGITLPGGR